MAHEREELPRPAWRDALELLTKEHEGNDVTIEILSRDLGDQVETQRLPLNYIEYDHKDDALIVGVGGHTTRFPVLLRHIIAHPQAILMHPVVPDDDPAVEVVGADGVTTLITMRPRPALPGDES